MCTGFTGSTIGPLPMVPISASVTAFGRVAIEDSKQWIQKTFPILHPEQEPFKRDFMQLAAECKSVSVGTRLACVRSWAVLFG